MLDSLRSTKACVRSAALALCFPAAAGSAPAGEGSDGTCPRPDLALYAEAPHATERGIRRRCELLEIIEADGGLRPGTLREQVRSELANRFVLEIDFRGEVDLPKRVIDYLLANMPEAAALVSAYSGTDYRATQTETVNGSDMFFVTNHDTFAANFTFLLARAGPDVSEHLFFESGFAKVFFWRVWGNSFIHYQLRDDGNDASRYDIKVHVFTDSRVLRAVLGSAPFRYFARSMFEGILEDVVSAVREFEANPEAREPLPPYFVAGLNSRLESSRLRSRPRERAISSAPEGGR